MINIRPGNRLHFVGDSITAFGWYLGMETVLDAAVLALPQTERLSTNSGRPGYNVGTSGSHVNTVANNPLVYTSSGVVGNKVADIATDVPTRILAFNPTIVFLEVGINDAIASTNQGAFTASYFSILQQVKAWNANTQILCVNELCFGEQWIAGPPPQWGANVQDNFIASQNQAIAAVANAFAADVADVRAACLVQEVALNSPAPGAVFGIMTSDAVHPNAAGKAMMCSTALAFCNVTE